MVGAKSGYTNKLILPSVSEDNYGTEMTIVCRQCPSIRSVTGTEGGLIVTDYDNRGNVYLDERTLVLASGKNGGILNVVSTPQGWLITNCSHDGCSDSGIILKFKVSITVVHMQWYRLVYTVYIILVIVELVVLEVVQER